MTARLLVLEDEMSLRRLFRRSLESEGYEVSEASGVDEAEAALRTQAIDLVLCDINLVGRSGLEFVRSLAVLPESCRPAVVMLTGMDDPGVVDEALTLGAYGYLVKPVRNSEVIIGVASALRRRELERARRDYINELEDKLLNRGAALRGAMKRLEVTEITLREAEQDTVDRLITALNLRSEETGAHIRRVGRYAALIADLCGIDSFASDEIRLAAMLHDVGKIGIPDGILLKPGRLTDEEFDIIKRHPHLGHMLLAEGRAPVLTLAASISLTHHERWDGLGYPRELLAEEIPIEGRIAAIADVFDALTSDRIYRAALTIEEADEIMKHERARAFDPDLLDVFLSRLDQTIPIRAEYPDIPATLEGLDDVRRWETRAVSP